MIHKRHSTGEKLIPNIDENDEHETNDFGDALGKHKTKAGIIDTLSRVSSRKPYDGLTKNVLRGQHGNWRGWVTRGKCSMSGRGSCFSRSHRVTSSASMVRVATSTIRVIRSAETLNAHPLECDPLGGGILAFQVGRITSSFTAYNQYRSPPQLGRLPTDFHSCICPMWPAFGSAHAHSHYASAALYCPVAGRVRWFFQPTVLGHLSSWHYSWLISRRHLDCPVATHSILKRLAVFVLLQHLHVGSPSGLSAVSRQSAGHLHRKPASAPSFSDAGHAAAVSCRFFQCARLSASRCCHSTVVSRLNNAAVRPRHLGFVAQVFVPVRGSSYCLWQGPRMRWCRGGAVCSYMPILL